jgi:hypothetical protein
MIYISSFIKTGSAIQKLMEGRHTDMRIQKEHGDRISLVSFFQNNGSRLIRGVC